MSHKLTAQIVRYCDILLFSLLRGSGLKYGIYMFCGEQGSGSPSYDGADRNEYTWIFK